MPRISPFHGLQFDVEVAGPLERVTAPPYDVISDRRRREYLAASPFSVVHLDLAEGHDDPEHPESRYGRAANLLADWELRGALVRTPDPVYFVYEMAYRSNDRNRSIVGLLCAMDLEPWGGSVTPHERTMPGPVEDRLRLLRATTTHLSPVYGTIAGPNEPFSRMLRAVFTTAPDAETRDEQGVAHRLWRMHDRGDVAEWLASEQLLIADGHHRYTTALRYRDERHAVDGPGPWDRVLTLVVDAASEHPPVLPFHRVQLSGKVPDVNGPGFGTLEEVLDACSDDEVVIGLGVREGDGVAYRMVRLSGGGPAVSALHTQLLDGAVPNGAIRFVTSALDADAAVRGGEAVCAYILPPTTSDIIRRVIDRGERLPQKSTYFWPKPLTGMVMMPLDQPAHAHPAPAPASDR